MKNGSKNLLLAVYLFCGSFGCAPEDIALAETSSPLTSGYMWIMWTLGVSEPRSGGTGMPPGFVYKPPVFKHARMSVSIDGGPMTETCGPISGMVMACYTHFMQPGQVVEVSVEYYTGTSGTPQYSCMGTSTPTGFMHALASTGLPDPFTAVSNGVGGCNMRTTLPYIVSETSSPSPEWLHLLWANPYGTPDGSARLYVSINGGEWKTFDDGLSPTHDYLLSKLHSGDTLDVRVGYYRGAGTYNILCSPFGVDIDGSTGAVMAITSHGAHLANSMPGCLYQFVIP